MEESVIVGAVSETSISWQTASLRWIRRGEGIILQQLWIVETEGVWSDDWRDVPLVELPREQG